MEGRIKNLVVYHLLDNFIRILVYACLTIISLKLVYEYFYPIRLKRDFAMGIFMIYSLYFLRKLYIGIDRDILKDLYKLERAIRDDDYDRDLNLGEFDFINKTLRNKDASIRRKDKFIKTSLAAISHDMKTPLTVINTNLALVKTTSDKDAIRLSKIKTESERIAAYIDDLMEVSGSFIDDIKLKDTSLNEFLAYLRSIISLCEDMREEEIGIIDEIGKKDRKFISYDRIKFNKAINQLINNAFDHKKSAVWIELRENNEELIITVADDGKGFDLENLDDMKRLFYTDNFSRNSGKGTGMGLFIAENYIKAMGARLILENQNGARAKIYLDLKEGKHGK
ncbi:HAMP domain-containing sensor histidine kinase [uncultured Anaerococcus sp.]|uniref:sensor histidine kinase n=1 Tax=uncultured Anaerococcus sp. TaxID=293428 RepID=UPI0025D8A55F|nr:HAMP domain-containing sensor histidine kinase [uncultured Anaerococcus sp.]